jgi:hypothetical protein
MLREGDSERIAKHIARMQREVRAIVHGIVELAWYMRGSIQYNDMMNMTPGERQVVSEFIEKRMEKVGKSMYPVY